MGTAALVLRRTALVLTALFAVGGLLFALGYAWTDLALGPALLITAAIAVPLVGLTILAARRPDVAPAAVLSAAVALYAVYAVLNLFIDVMDAPDLPVIALVLALPIAVMGQRRDLWAGLLMLVLAAFAFVSVLVGMFREAAVDRPPLGDLLTTSTGVVVVPLAVLGILFLIAGALGSRAAPTGGDVVQPPARDVQLH